MYIGPWQEYKLAKLIQHHQQQQTACGTPATSEQQLRPGSRQRRPLVPRQSSKDLHDDTASVTSSTRSGISFKSTQSAPSQLPSQPSAQSRLNDFYQHYERNARQDGIAADADAKARSNASSQQQARRVPGMPPRPRSGGRTAGVVAAKRRAKAKSGPSFEDERRARIQHMKRLYGLGEPELELQPQVCSASTASTSLSRVDSNTTLRQLDTHEAAGYREQAEIAVDAIPRPAPAVVDLDADSFTPDFDRALVELQASMDVREDTHLPEPPAWGKGHEDPLTVSFSAESMGGSGGLIAWSKNLRPEDLSPDATLASFF